MSKRDIIRTVVFSPFRRGMGPRFTLRLWDTGNNDIYGKSCLGYQLTYAKDNGNGYTTVKVFEAEDFYPSLMYPIDGDKCIVSLMNFLCLQKGDTDEEYFKDYTEVQCHFRDTYAEDVAMAVLHRFGEEDAL